MSSASVKLAIPPFASALVAVGAGYLGMFAPNQAEEYYSKISRCSIPARQRLSTDLTDGSLPALDNSLCFLVPFFKGIANDRVALGAAALVLSAALPALMHHCYTAVSPNRRSPLLGAMAVLPLHYLGRIIGTGFAFGSAGAVLLALGAYQQMRRSSIAQPVVPTPAASVYWSNLAVTILALSSFLTGFFGTEGGFWLPALLACHAYPLYLTVFLALAVVQARQPVDERAARQELLEYSAEQVSYAFERTWSYYRKVGLASLALYWYGLSRVLPAVVFPAKGSTSVFSPTPSRTLSMPATYLVYDFAALAAYLAAAVVIERVTIRPVSLQAKTGSAAGAATKSAPSSAASTTVVASTTHPLTGLAVSPLYIDCLRAIHLAPAGNPRLERGTWEPILAALIGGPGLAAALWWSGGEEEAGWLARRAWREAAAVQGAKKA